MAVRQKNGSVHLFECVWLSWVLIMVYTLTGPAGGLPQSETIRCFVAHACGSAAVQYEIAEIDMRVSFSAIPYWTTGHEP